VSPGGGREKIGACWGQEKKGVFQSAERGKTGGFRKVEGFISLLKKRVLTGENTFVVDGGHRIMLYEKGGSKKEKRRKKESDSLYVVRKKGLKKKGVASP